jgi:hypothetical protein
LEAVPLLHRLSPDDGPLLRPRGVVGMLTALACGTFVSATVGSVASWLGSVIEVQPPPYVWRTW